MGLQIGLLLGYNNKDPDRLEIVTKCVFGATPAPMPSAWEAESKEQHQNCSFAYCLSTYDQGSE